MATPWMPQEQADLDYQSIDRRRQMANMLMQDSMGPIQNMGQGPYASLISPFQGVQKMLAAYLGGRGMNRADKDQKDVLMDRNIRLAQALDAVGKGPQQNAPGGITAPQDPGAIVQQPRQEFQDGPIVKPFNPNIPQGRPDMPSDLATALRTPGAIEPNVPTFGPATGDMPQDIVPPVGITAQKERPETAAEFAARVRIAASTRGINPMALFQSPEVAGKYQQMLEMEKEGRTFQRDIDKLNVQDELAKGLKKYERGLSENDLANYLTDPSGRVIGFNRAGQPTTAATVPQDPTKLVQIGPDGKPVINQVALDAQEKIASARSNKQTTNIKVDTAGATEFAKKVSGVAGGRLETSLNQASGAVDLLNTINGMRSALDSGKVRLGPTATTRQYLGQLAETLGIAGKDEKETLSNTRKMIQGLAQAELDVAQQMKGQGPLTEAERAIIRRAALGQFENMTEPELRGLLDAMEKTARFKIDKHNRFVNDNVKTAPGTESAAPSLILQAPERYQQQAPQGGALTPAEQKELEELRRWRSGK